MKKWPIVLAALLLLIIISVLFFYFALVSPDNSSTYTVRELINPVTGLSDEQAREQFDEEFVFYLLYSLEVYNLHDPPLSENHPKMLFSIDEDFYYALVDDGEIIVNRGEIDNQDLTFFTTKEEAVRMLRKRAYIEQSFQSGESSIELKVDKATLFAKGYLNMYNALTGKTITGNVIEIYTS